MIRLPLANTLRTPRLEDPALTRWNRTSAAALQRAEATSIMLDSTHRDDETT